MMGLKNGKNHFNLLYTENRAQEKTCRPKSAKRPKGQSPRSKSCLFFIEYKTKNGLNVSPFNSI